MEQKRANLAVKLTVAVALGAAVTLGIRSIRHQPVNLLSAEATGEAVAGALPAAALAVLPTSLPQAAAVVLPSAPPQTGALVARDTTSLQNMTKTLLEFTKPNRSVDDLLVYLRSSQQNPFVVDNSNQFTGDMEIVRTNSPMPGTRYFHAQYFSDDKNEKFLQHMSFEFRPGPESMDTAVQTVQSVFSNLTEVTGTPGVTKADFREWRLENGYVVWVKKLGPADIKDDPFNAYTAADIGVVRIAVELSPHEN